MTCPTASSFQIRDLPSFSGAPSLSPSSSSPRVKIRIGVSLGVLFDTTQILLLRERCGEKAAARYMRNRIDEPLPRGPGLAAFAKMARFNKLGQDPYFEFYVLSDLSPEIEKRTERSIPLYGLNHGSTRLQGRGALAAQGKEIAQGHPTENASLDLVLSTREQDVLTALENGIPAGHVDPRHIAQGQDTNRLTIGFDLDRALFLAFGKPGTKHCYIDNEEYTRTYGLKAARQRERSCRNHPAQPGPIAPFFFKLFAMRDKINADNSLPDLRLPIITARSGEARKRAKKTLKLWKCLPERKDFVSTGWDPKGPKNAELKTDLFIDDGPHHILSTQESSPNTLAIHMPWTPNHIDRIKETDLLSPRRG